MIVELQQALCPSDLGPSMCGLCEQDFEIESVIANSINGREPGVGVICPECVAYLGSRSESCPSIETYRRLLEQYPEPVWADDGEFHSYMMAAIPEEQERVYASAVLTERV
jgi:hypothetical protein